MKRIKLSLFIFSGYLGMHTTENFVPYRKTTKCVLMFTYVERLIIYVYMNEHKRNI